MFDTELEFFITHQDELVAKHKGRALIISGRQVVGVRDTPLEAYLEAQKGLPPGSFMIQPCEPGPGAYSVTLAHA